MINTPNDKCNSISNTRKINKISHTYRLHNQELKHVPSTTYLGVELSSDLTWRDQINKVYSKGNKQPGFLGRNLQINNTKVKETAYTGLVRPALEYCSTIWDPHHHKYIDKLQKVQRRAARFVCNSNSNKASVTDMLKNLRGNPSKSVDAGQDWLCSIRFRTCIPLPSFKGD